MKPNFDASEDTTWGLGASPSFASLRRLGRMDQSIVTIFEEFTGLVRLLASDAPTVDADVKAGLRAAADRALLALAALPASTLDELRLKVTACGIGEAFNARRTHFQMMLEVTIVLDINTLQTDGSHEWLEPWVGG